MTLGDRIKAAREKRGWSQNELASRANMGQPTLQRIEAGKRSPGMKLVVAVADALSMSLDELIGRQAPFSAMLPESDASHPQSLEERLDALETNTLAAAKTAREALALAQQLRDARSRRRRPEAAS